MSIGRNHPDTSNGIRDEAADYLAAHIAEYESYSSAGMTEKAAEVAAVLHTLGHDVRPQKPVEGQKERAVSAEPLEQAVDSDAPAKRRPGRPRKDAAE